MKILIRTYRGNLVNYDHIVDIRKVGPSVRADITYGNAIRTEILFKTSSKNYGIAEMWQELFAKACENCDPNIINVIDMNEITAEE